MLSVLAAATSLLLISFHEHTALACQDPGINICASGEKACLQMDGDRWLFTDGREIGERATQYSHSDLTQGCYCELSDVYRPSYGSATEIATSIGDSMLVTSCTPDFQYWWDGQYVMTRMGGTLTKDLGRTPEYEAMYCQAKADDYGSPPTTKDHDIILIDWPTTAQAHMEVTLPSNVKYFDGADVLCPGYDIQSDFYPNSATASALSASQVTNCTCHVSSITAIGTTGGASSNDGISFLTICDQSNNVYFNGKGFRNTRNGVTASEHSLSDFCGYPRQSDYQLAYVVAASSSSSDSMRTSTTRSGTATGTGSAAPTITSMSINSGSRLSISDSRNTWAISSLLLAALLSAATFVL